MSTTKLPPYSVLMSVYAKDKPEYLDAAIASMARQTVPFRDMVVVCDGPLTDGLDAVLDNWAWELDGRLSVHRLPENGGLGPALAAGLPLCRCDIVARMDADDVSRLNRCELLLEKMTAESLDLVGGAIEEFESEPHDMGAIRRPPLTTSEIVSYAKARNPFNHVSVMFDRRAVEAVGSYKPFPFMEDYYLWVRMLMNGCSCANIPDVVVDVRTGKGMYDRRSNAGYLKSQKKFFDELLRIGFLTPPRLPENDGGKGAHNHHAHGGGSADLQRTAALEDGRKPVVSVVMPVYNSERTLHQAIESVYAQTFQDWELILVDDASTDASPQIERALADADSKVKLVEKHENSGVADSRNVGVKVARGEWVAYLDSDDVWMPIKLEKQLEAAKTGADIVFTGYGYLNAESDVASARFDVPGEATYEGMLRRNVMSTSGVMAHRGIMLAFPFDSGVYHEDLCEWLTLLKSGFRAVGVNEALHYVRIAQSESRSGNKLRAAVRRMGLYRHIGLGPVRSLCCFLAYAIEGVRKYSSVSFGCEGVERR